MEITHKAFAALCYLVLMDHHGDGYQKAHPDRIEEKSYLFDRGYEAYAALDRQNQKAVLWHLRNWHYDIPEPIKQYENEIGELLEA